MTIWTRLTHAATGGGVDDRSVGIRVVIADNDEAQKTGEGQQEVLQSE